MNEYKFTKSHIHSDRRKTVMEEEAEYFERIEKNYTTLPKLKEKLKKLQGELDKILEAPVVMAYSAGIVRRSISDLVEKIRAIQNKDDELAYYFNLHKFLEVTKKNETNCTDDETQHNHFKLTEGNQKGDNHTLYMKMCFNRSARDSEPSIDITQCSGCGSTDLVNDTKQADIICRDCGLCRKNLQEGHSTEYREGVTIITPYTYKRINHFKEWLSQFQARESTDIPKEIYMGILSELKKERITDPEQITTPKIRKVLKKLRLNKFYEHIPAIISKLTGSKAVRIPSQLETQMINMFTQIQAPFSKWCKIIAPNRKNFLSYSYTLRQMCILLREDELSLHFGLLKSREKNFVQDKIWEGICKELGWPFHKTV